MLAHTDRAVVLEKGRVVLAGDLARELAADSRSAGALPRRLSTRARLPVRSITREAAMILEVADIRIPPGKNAEFDAAIERGLETVLAAAEGLHRGHQVQRGIESPERYLLMIWWDTLENHTVDFRQGPLFAEWRAHHRPVLRRAAARRALRAARKSA